jgi:hypothetical protein
MSGIHLICISLDKHHVGNVDDDSEICPITNQLAHSQADSGHQKTVFDRMASANGTGFYRLIGMLVESDNSSHVLL